MATELTVREARLMLHRMDRDLAMLKRWARTERESALIAAHADTKRRLAEPRSPWTHDTSKVPPDAEAGKLSSSWFSVAHWLDDMGRRCRSVERELRHMDDAAEPLPHLKRRRRVRM